VDAKPGIVMAASNTERRHRYEFTVSDGRPQRSHNELGISELWVCSSCRAVPELARVIHVTPRDGNVAATAHNGRGGLQSNESTGSDSAGRRVICGAETSVKPACTKLHNGVKYQV
jgi:hypothetical protein